MLPPFDKKPAVDESRLSRLPYWLPLLSSLILMAMIVIISVMSVLELKSAMFWRGRTYQVLDIASSFIGSLTDTQRGLRGYLLTGNPHALVPYHSGVDTAPRQVEALVKVTGDNPAQQQRLKVLTADLDDVISYSRQLISTYDNQGLPAAMELEKTGKGLEVMNRARADLDTFIDDERQLLVQRDIRITDDFRKTTRLLILSSLLAAAMLVLANILAVREIRRRRKAEQAERSLNAHLARTLMMQNAILNSANYAMIAATTEGVVTAFNAAAERWLGHAAADVMGKATPALWHDGNEVAERTRILSQELGREIEPGFEVFVAKAKMGIVEENEWTFIRKDGSRFPVTLSVTALRSESGTISGFLGVIANITKRKDAEKRLRASEEIFRLMVEGVQDYAILMLDPQGRVTSWSSGAERIKGYQAAEIIGQHFSVFYPPEARAAGKPENVLAGALADGQVQDEGWRVRKDGSLFFANVTISAIRDANGQLLGFGKVTRDITGSRQAEKALQESEARYHSLFENMLEGYAYCRALIEDGQLGDFIFLETNGAFETITGLKNVTGKKYSEVFRSVLKDSPEVLEIYNRVVQSGEPESYERFSRELGIWVAVSVYCPEKEHFVVVFEDITARKNAQDVIEDAAKRLQMATRASGIGVWDWDLRTNTVVWDERMFALYGFEPTEAKEVNYDTWAKAVLPEDLDKQAAILQETVRQRGRNERQFRIRRANDGAIRMIHAEELTVTDADGEPLRVVGVNRDITDQEMAAAKLAASEKLLSQFIKHAPAAIAMLDTELRYVQASDRWIKDYHLEGQEIIGHSHYEIFPDIPQRWKEIHQRVLRGAVEQCDEEPFPRADGRLEWLQWEARPWRKVDGEIGGLVFYTQVITTRKESEERLRESEERFRGAFQNSAIGMAMVSLEGRWLRVNRAICEIVGRSEEELLACTFQDITHPDDLGKDLAHLNALVAGEIDHYQMEKRYFHKAGNIVWVLLAVTLVRTVDGRPIHFVSQIEDITVRREAAQRLQASLEEKEVMLREIHHRVKNNLQVITSLLQLQSGYLHDPKDAEIFKECQARIHAMGLVHDRLYRSGNLSTIDFGGHLRDLTGLIVRGQSSPLGNIRLIVEADSIEVNLDTAIPLGLIASELVTNAYKHAFRGRDHGTITMRLYWSGEKQVTLATVDDGVGLPPGFEPEKARSLGLRLIKALSRQLDADFFIDSSSAGTAMKLVFQV